MKPHTDLRTHAHLRRMLDDLDAEARELVQKASKDALDAMAQGAPGPETEHELGLFKDIVNFGLRSAKKAAQAFRLGLTDTPPLGLPLSVHERRNTYRTRIADLILAAETHKRTTP